MNTKMISPRAAARQQAKAAVALYRAGLPQYAGRMWREAIAALVEAAA